MEMIPIHAGDGDGYNVRKLYDIILARGLR